MTQFPGAHSQGSPYNPASQAGGAPGYPPAIPPNQPTAPTTAPYAPATSYSRGAAGGPQPYPAQPAPPRPATPATGRKSLRPPAILLGAGASVLALGIILVVLAATGISSVAGSLSAFRTGYEMEAELESDTEYGLYREAHFSASQPECQVVSPDGEEISVSSAATENVTVNDHRLFSRFTSDTAGTYTLTCSLEDEETVYVGLTTSTSGLLQSAGSLFGGILLAVVGAGIGLGGLVWLLVRRSASKRTASQITAPAAATAYAGSQAPAAGAAYTPTPAQGYTASPAPHGSPGQQAYPSPQAGHSGYSGYGQSTYGNQQQWPHA